MHVVSNCAVACLQVLYTGTERFRAALALALVYKLYRQWKSVALLFESWDR